MNHDEFVLHLQENRLLSPIWKYVLDLIKEQIKDKEDLEDYLNTFAVFFSFVDDGNVCASLDKETLLTKWKNKLVATRIMMEAKEDFNAESFDSIKDVSISSIEKVIDKITESNLSSIIGSKRMFEIESGYLYIRKYNVARKGVIASLGRLFKPSNGATASFQYEQHVTGNFKLSKGQEKGATNGVNRNLVITGGPGTGKTTSVLFILLSLLIDDPEYDVHLVAPSGKASSRMKESIIGGFSNISDDFKNSHSELIEKIKNLEESTIHRLLAIDHNTNAFSFNKNHQFKDKSIFIIDEASMIDICLFNSLLEAIPDSARVFIMGDKNQLPSVEAGAVFGELLKKESLKDNVVELDESKRFKEGTRIFELATAVNNGDVLPIKEDEWKEYKDFDIYEVDKNTCPIFYYKNTSFGVSERNIIESICRKWGEKFYKKLQEACSELDYEDMNKLKEVFDYTEESKILCAENDGIRGVHDINKFIKNNFIDRSKPSSVIGYYPGELMMINKNNKMLDLYNGDSGILVTFKDDSTLYFMVKKKSLIVQKDEKLVDKIFKLGDFVFYPLRLITQSEIDSAYAITVHKSQGSDYKSILVILPSKKGHPLLNRQIVYTAITRTKGNTYIVSNMDILNEAKDTVLERDTNIA